jgi:hypothetical protein
VPEAWLVFAGQARKICGRIIQKARYKPEPSAQKKKEKVSQTFSFCHPKTTWAPLHILINETYSELCLAFERALDKAGAGKEAEEKTAGRLARHNPSLTLKFDAPICARRKF